MITIDKLLNDPEIKVIESKRKRFIELVNSIMPNVEQLEKEFNCKIGFIKKPSL